MTYLLQVSTCWIVFYGVYLLFLRKETFFSINRYYLIGSLIAGVVIPYLGTYLPANETSTEVYTVMSQLTSLEVQPSIHLEPRRILSWSLALWSVYILGAIIVSARLCYGLSRIYRIYRSADKTRKANYTLVESDTYHLPFSFFHLIFISKQLPLSDKIDQVLQHEELHADQWHSLDIILIEVLQIFFWFNPILIMYKSALRQSHEYLADAYVTKKHNKSSYGQLLLRQSTSGLEIALANQFFHSQIKKRITMMYKEKSKRSAMVKYVAALPVLLGMLLVFSSSQESSTIPEVPTVSIVDGAKELFGVAPMLKSEEGVLEEGSDYEIDHQAGKLRLINDEYKDKNLSVTFPEQGEPIYKIVEQMPRFPGCEDIEGDEETKQACAQKKMLEFIYSNVNYPQAAQKKGIEGTTVIQFVVWKDGQVKDAKILRDLDGGCGAESLRVVNASPRWIPGKLKGKAVNVQYVIPIKYKLQEKTADETVVVVAHGDKNDQEIKKNLNKHVDPPVVDCAEVYKVVEEMPRFLGCEDMQGDHNALQECADHKMLEFIYTKIKYPKEARQQGIEGVAVVSMTIAKDGSLQDVRILRNPGGGTGEEAKRVIEMMPKWTPGKQGGHTVPVLLTIPIKFKLEGEKQNDQPATQEASDGQPLYIIDGKERPGLNIHEIDPDDIQEINVLKGEKAIEKYGQKATGGVIEITMKTGTSWQLNPLSFTAFPSPHDGNFTIEYELEMEEEAILIIQDAAGRTIKVWNHLPAKNKIAVDLTDEAPGMLFINLYQGGKQTTIKSMINR